VKPRLLIAALMAAAVVVWAFWLLRARDTKVRLAPDVPGALRLVFLDVGYGDACWVRTPAGRNLLIDAGPGAAGKLRDGGRQLVFSPENVPLSVESFLLEHGVRRLDAVFVSHAHYDHWGGLDRLVASGRIEIGALYESDASGTDPAYEKFRARLKAAKVQRVGLSAGQKLGVGDPAVAIEVLGPARAYPESMDPVSNASLVLKLKLGGVSALFTGDAAPEEEFDLLESGERVSATLLKVAAHGGGRSTTAPFLDWAHPSVAVISVATPNPFGTPSDDVLQRFIQRDIPYYRTDLDGTVLFVTDGKDWSVYPRWHD
jgi:competence protein ComEC